jgi:CTP-dependent riboflavin kinase
LVDLSDPTWIIAAASIVAVALSYYDMRKRIKREQQASGELAEVMKIMREQLVLFRKQIQNGQLSLQDTQRQQNLQNQNEVAWKNVLNGLKAAKLAKDILSGLGDED